jgi:hypothetical protein
MALRKSHSKGSKFWGCLAFREDGCDGTAPYHGPGARAGLELTIRSIENGYIVSAQNKFVDNIEDEEEPDFYCADQNEIKDYLDSFFDKQIAVLLKRIETSTEFEDEVDQEVVKNVKVKVARRGTKSIDEIMAKVAAAKKKAEAGVVD